MIEHSLSARNAVAYQIKTLLEDGAAIPTTPKIRLFDNGGVVLVELRAAYGNASSGAISVAETVTATAIASGVPVRFEATDSDDYMVYKGTAGGVGSDLVVSPNEIVAGQPVEIPASPGHRYIAAP